MLTTFKLMTRVLPLTFVTLVVMAFFKIISIIDTMTIGCCLIGAYAVVCGMTVRDESFEPWHDKQFKFMFVTTVLIPNIIILTIRASQ